MLKTTQDMGSAVLVKETTNVTLKGNFNFELNFLNYLNCNLGLAEGNCYDIELTFVNKSSFAGNVTSKIENACTSKTF